MKKILDSFHLSTKILKEDKMIALLSFVPMVLGAILYYLVGMWVYTDFFEWIKGLMQNYIGSATVGIVLHYFLLVILTIFVLAVTSWTFVLTVSLISSPFNDMISARVEANMRGGEVEPITSTFFNTMKRVFGIVINEVKKIAFILLLTVFALGIGLIPIFVPVSVCVTALLLSVSFLDYCFARSNLPFKKCFSQVKSNFFVYLVAGFIFLVALSIPLINLFVLPFAVIYFSVLYVKTSP